jgi:uncharacterized protein (TIGR02246 family)
MKAKDSSPSLSEADLAAAKELDQRLTEAMSRKDVDAVMACFSNDADLVVVLDGTVYRGPEEMRAGVQAMFDHNESVKLEVNEISLVPSGDAIIGVGTATHDHRPRSGARKLVVERWSDLRRKIDGRWVYVLNHTTHLPD